MASSSSVAWVDAALNSCWRRWQRQSIDNRPFIHFVLLLGTKETNERTLMTAPTTQQVATMMIIRLLLQLLLQLNILFKIGRGGFGGRVRNGNSDEATGRAGSSQQEISSPHPFPSLLLLTVWRWLVVVGGREVKFIYNSQACTNTHTCTCCHATQNKEEEEEE